MTAERTVLARARTDAADCLVEADEPLAGLQRRCGGELPGTVAIPQLLEAVSKARTMGLKLARSITATDGEETIRAWVEIAPQDSAGGGGCAISVGSWQSAPRAVEPDAEVAARRIMIDRAVAELTARLDPAQRPLAVEVSAPDLGELAKKLRDGRDRPWSEWLTFPDVAHHQPLHWRLLDGARCRAPGSDRIWTVTLVPLGHPEPGSAGFELLLVADTPLADAPEPVEADDPGLSGFGRELTPVLRPPIARIIANAETIRSRLAGPLAEEYSDYAADIAAAGQHLLSLVEDLADLDIVDSDGFVTAPEPIDLADVARRAVGILGMRAQAKTITLTAPAVGESLPATGEFRRVLQILLNLVGNAIAYSPAGSRVTLALEKHAGSALVTVADQGPGLEHNQAARIFEKFERLGRSGDGGSGLGLYISRKLARAMGGELTVSSAPGEGARFTLTLPADD
ncbi:HAMP domain-containing sensor histidine kinase [Altererythrobacter sp. TH136]|uniref:sensor histidine kinase n=1 Tax=Altererythrobacter sp. TH136 TaxID=2067415 RepID=UPI001164EA9F|nr:HAMP domain-containing sensor histidine kinase [Altererythrobacter sp. TH136]QDM39972.1 HAMP domain-containing histidine kinase [Altererythrobacter sp. TH136]